MKYLSLILIAIFALIFAQHANAEGNIGFSFNQVVDQTNWGLVGGYETDGNPVDIEFDGQLQSGDIYRGKYTVAAIFDVSTVDIKLINEGTVKGYELNDLGREQNLVAAANIPIGDLEFDVGVFGRNAGPFGSLTALDILTEAGVNASKIEGLGLEDIGPDNPGLSLQLGNSVGVMIATELKWRRIEIGVTSYLQLASESETRVHQILVDLQTSRRIGDIDLTLGLDIAGQLYGDVVEYEKSLFGSVGKRW